MESYIHMERGSNSWKVTSCDDKKDDSEFISDFLGPLLLVGVIRHLGGLGIIQWCFSSLAEGCTCWNLPLVSQLARNYNSKLEEATRNRRCQATPTPSWKSGGTDQRSPNCCSQALTTPLIRNGSVLFLPILTMMRV